ncbi:class I SAM-dependent methyltransferase [Arthrobacter gandavensis]|uniref:class I SAM-dependent methyltransferase n=1 Tax=Arthrobacter gandavensis TaxID=169960 RepID=UPI00188F84FB|nr:class I SAM-dependent methyltransferase [Arthrobacter gandavensis]MBF4995056.1 class I SAM-dependent methyltransferase [Arthrobacter gandavensis]
MDTHRPGQSGEAHERKAQHRRMSALGGYAAVASEVVPGLGAVLSAEAGISAGDYVLDVAAGTGNASIPAAQAGARVVALDLNPELLEAGRSLAGAQGVELDWVEGDAEDLPFQGDTFDAVISCAGVMFAPDHRQAAAELVRVCRPGGTIALLNWTPEGFVGELIAIMGDYQRSQPAGPGAPLWGREDYVTGLFPHGTVTGWRSRKEMATVDRFEDPEHFQEFCKTNLGPAVGVYRGIGNDPERSAALDRELSSLAERHARGSARGMEMDWEYLLLRGTAAG